MGSTAAGGCSEGLDELMDCRGVRRGWWWPCSRIRCCLESVQDGRMVAVSNMDQLHHN